MKIRIGIPCSNGGFLKAKCEYSLDVLKMLDSRDELPFKIDICEVQCATISKGRNGLVKLDHDYNKKNIISEYDYFLSLDSDIEFTPDNLIDLYNCAYNNDYDLLSGFYKCRGNASRGAAGYWINNIVGHTNFNKMLNWEMSGIHSVDWVAAGFCLIKKEVFEIVEYPWYYEYFVETVDKVYIAGEDLGFCKKCRENNIKINVNCDIKVNHLL